MVNDKLKQKLKLLPAAPGVYFHKNAAGEIIYVGKAAVLKNRVRQYFQKTVKDPKTTALVEEIFDTDWIVDKWVLSKDLTKIKVTMVDANYSKGQEIMEIPTDKIIEFIKKEVFEL